MLLISASSARAAIDAIYLLDQTETLQITQRAQQQLGYASGYIVSDIEGATLISPFFEIGARVRLLARYGGVITSSLAALVNATGISAPPSSSTTDNYFSFGGYDRPMIRARQLVYGNFDYGRWYLVDLGLAAFNAAGYTSELFRYWSSRVGFHESLQGGWVDTELEVAMTLRSLTQFAQPSNLGLIFPPTVDGSIGFRKNVAGKFPISTDIKFEQALVSTQLAGAYDPSSVPPLGAPTYFVFKASAGWKIGNSDQIIFTYANRVYRWPDNDSSALWEFFEEGFYGQSYALAWRGQW